MTVADAARQSFVAESGGVKLTPMHATVLQLGEPQHFSITPGPNGLEPTNRSGESYRFRSRPLFGIQQNL